MITSVKFFKAFEVNFSSYPCLCFILLFFRQERQVESLPDDSQNTSDLFGSLSGLTLSATSEACSEKTQRQQLLEELYSDSESVSCANKKSNVAERKTVPNEDGVEEGEIVEDDVQKPVEVVKDDVNAVKTPIKDDKAQQKGKKSKVGISKNVKIKDPITKVRTPTSRKAVVDKKSVSKIVPGTVDDSACDLGEIMQKQSSLVEKDEVTTSDQTNETETKDSGLIQEDGKETDVGTNMNDVAEVPVQAERLIELCDLAVSQETIVPQKPVSPCHLIGQKSIEAIVMQSQELFGDQSNISLLIAADIFLQNENTVKDSVENTSEVLENGNISPQPKKIEDQPPKLCVSPPETQFTGFNSEEIEASPRNNSNDSLKENICTPISNTTQNACHNHGSTPKTMTKSEPKQLLTQLNNGPDSSIPTPDTSKDVTEEQIAVENTSRDEDSLNSSAKRKIIETKSTQYVVEETEDMVICTINRKSRKKEKKEKKSKHKHKHKERERRGLEEKM